MNLCNHDLLVATLGKQYRIKCWYLKPLIIKWRIQPRNKFSWFFWGFSENVKIYRVGTTAWDWHPFLREILDLPSPSLVSFWWLKLSHPILDANGIPQTNHQHSYLKHPAGGSVDSVNFASCSKFCLVHYNVSQWEFHISHCFSSTIISI